MIITLTYPTNGRGAWGRLGGTLNGTGTGPGPYYRAPFGRGLMPGQSVDQALHINKPISVDDYAVWSAVKAFQVELGVEVDGLFGPVTAERAMAWQAAHGLAADGVIGPVTSKVLWRVLIDKVMRNLAVPDAVGVLVRGHMGWESAWDPGAVGSLTPQDLGLGQISGPAFPNLSVDFRLNPRLTIPFVAGLVGSNLTAMDGNTDDAIAAYNLGVGGAKEWVTAGRPQMFKGIDVWHYIKAVTTAAQ